MKELPSEIAPLLDQPVAIFGCGISGLAAAELLDSLKVEYRFYDEVKEGGARGVFSARNAREHRLVIYSPGFTFEHRWLKEARCAGCVCLAEIDFAYLSWRGRLIAVTGTNGKTTLTEFLAYSFKRHNIDAVAVGNNGYPLSRLCASSNREGRLAICEVSSFQAESLCYFRSDALIWINFHEGHEDRYNSQEGYFASKWNLVERLSTGVFLAGESVAEAAEDFAYSLPEETTIVGRSGKNTWLLPAGSVFATYPQRENLQFARVFWEREGLPEPALRASAERFPSRRHRLMKVTEVDGIGFWNDSKGTNFSASLAAISEFSQPLVWIGGGKFKGGEVNGFGHEVASRVKSGFLIGETAPSLALSFAAAGKPAECFSSLEDAVTSAYESSVTGDAVLFSPGFSSFDMFRNFAERGSCYERAVLNLKNQLIHH